MLSRLELGFVGVALAVHIGALGVARTVGPGNRLLSNRPPAPLAIEFEFPDAPKRPTIDTPHERSTEESPVDPSRSPETQRGARNPVAVSNGPGTEGGTASAEGGPSENPGVGPIETGPDSSNSWSVPEEGGLPGLGGRPIYSDPALFAINTSAPPANTEAPKAKPVDRDAATKLTKDLVRQKDKQLGLDLPAAGTVASIIRQAVLSSDAPGTSRASFQVALGPGGRVQSVKVVSMSGGNASTWDGIARQVRGALAAQKLNLSGDYEKGAVIIVSVQSKMSMPSGAEVGAGLKLSLTQSFDVADIGAKPVRTVTASHSASPVN